MWTEITKDLVSEEAIKEVGYEYEENGEFYYVMEYLRYVSLPTILFFNSRSFQRALSSTNFANTSSVGGRPSPRRSHRRYQARPP